MARSSVEPRNVAREFATHELFFSTTDRKGIIDAGNGVFGRISGYTLDELLGSPHNMIRHPDMPQAVFKLFWDYLLAGRTVAAYVKNLAKDGSHYWVMALAVPIGDRFLSVRFKPTSPLLGQVEALYRAMRAIEATAKADDASPAAVMQAATDRLEAALHELGFADYDAFMRTAIRDELKSRDQILAGSSATVVPTLPSCQVADSAIQDVARVIYSGCFEANRRLSALFEQLDNFVALNEQLRLKSNSVLDLTRAFRFISLNTAIKSARLGDQGAGLGVIARYLGDSSAEVTALVSNLARQIGATSDKLAAVIFDLAGARLQTEMILVFCHELVAGADESDDGAVTLVRQRAMISSLRAAFERTIASCTSALTSFSLELGGLNTSSDELQKIMVTLEFTQLGGMVEANRLDQVATFGVIFTEVRKQLDETKSDLLELASITRELSTLSVEGPRVAALLTQADLNMDRQVSRL